MTPLRTTFVLLAALLGASDLAGCTSAGLCRTGSEDCRQNDDGTCDQGLTKMGDLCVKGGSGGSGGMTGGTGMTGGSGGTGMTGGTGGTSASDECVGDTIEAACARFCKAFCDNQESLCIASTCPAGECEPGGEVFDLCLKQCDGPECAQNLCMNELVRTCEEFAYRKNESDMSEPWKPGCYSNDPTCVIHGEDRCSDSCGTTRHDAIDPSGENTADNGVGGDLAKNGLCEDGGSASSDLCPRGTDCSDCGVRTCIPQGQRCGDHEDCCEYFGMGAFCVNVGTVDVPDNRCLLSCTESMTCPAAQRCTPVSNNRDSVCAPR